jgi:hypothetical protein
VRVAGNALETPRLLLSSSSGKFPDRLAMCAKPGGWGRQYAQDIDAYRKVAGPWIVGQDLPQEPIP